MHHSHNNHLDGLVQQYSNCFLYNGACSLITADYKHARTIVTSATTNCKHEHKAHALNAEGKANALNYWLQNTLFIFVNRDACKP